MLGSPRQRQAHLLIVGAFAAAVLVVLAIDAPLGWDESVYAQGGRQLVGDAPPGAAPFPLYRPAGMQLLAAPGVALGGSERALRALPAAVAILALVLFGALGRRAVGPWPAALACAAWPCSHALIARSAELLSDIPSLALYMLALALAVSELGRPAGDGPRPRLLLVAPLAAGSFYLRYGNALLLALTAAAVGIMYRRALWRARWLLAATAAATLALLAPHLSAARAATGSPLGVVALARDKAGLRHVGQGFVDYAGLIHWIGPVLGALAVVGAVRGARLMWRCRGTDRCRIERTLWLIAAAHLPVMGLAFHGRPRFVFAALLMLALIGARAVSDRLGARAVSDRLRRRAPITAAAAVTLAAVAVATAALTAWSTHRLGRSRQVIVSAADAIRADAGGRPCAALAAVAAPLAWYSGCAVHDFGRAPPEQRLRRLVVEPPSRLDDDRRYVVFVDRARREPTDAQRRAYLPHLSLVAEIPATGPHFGAARVYRVATRPDRQPLAPPTPPARSAPPAPAPPAPSAGAHPGAQ